jgi:hypothetical protein
MEVGKWCGDRQPRKNGATDAIKPTCRPKALIASGFILEMRLISRSAARDGTKQPELERFRAKWIPVRVKKTRQNKSLELWF